MKKHLKLLSFDDILGHVHYMIVEAYVKKSTEYIGLVPFDKHVVFVMVSRIH